MMELLSPAGNRECLEAAVQNGADAVYFGGSMLNARRFADNFSGDSLVSALDYCHEYGVRAYITVNTLVFDRELPAALDFAAELYRYGADALLVQDIGLARLIRRNIPQLTLHASTQMGIHDIGGLQYCESIGIKRAVLAREVSLKQIELLRQNCSIELEAFGHGALCMSFSGSCLYSSMSGERSGNRGTCAQPCRKAASVSGRPGASDFCLSPNDICMIEHLPELEKAGVCCIKLEGRMKKPDYVAAVTRCYRAALDGADPAEIKRMKQYMFRFFNRGEFSTSHFFGDSVLTDRIGSGRPDAEDLALLHRTSVSGIGRTIDFKLRLRVGEPAELTAACGEKTVKLSSDETVVKASKSQNEATYAERLSKLGGTAFRMGKCTIDMTPDCYISASALNKLRRNAADRTAESFRARNHIETAGFDMKTKAIAQSCTAGETSFVYARCANPEDAAAALDSGAEIVAVEPCHELEQSMEELIKHRTDKNKLLLALPNALITEKQTRFISKLIASGCFDGAEANNIGQLALIREMKLKIAGIGLNALNRHSCDELFELGFNYVIPSQELSSIQLRDLCEAVGSGLIIIIHGRVPLMQLLHCPVKEHKGCRNCRGNAGIITDENGREFPLTNIRFEDQCLVRMLNCFPTDLIDMTDKLPSSSGVCMSFVGEPRYLIGDRINAYRSAKAGIAIAQLQNSTRGHWNRKVD